MSCKGFGEFEEFVLLVVCILDGNVYGVFVKEEVEKYSGRLVFFGVVYIMFYCLEDKGFLSLEFGGNIVKCGDWRKWLFIIIILGRC